jgi:hypothetical protein
MDTWTFVGIILGVISVGFNLFQLYQGHLLKQKLRDEERRYKTSLLGIWKTIAVNIREITALGHRGESSQSIASTATGLMLSHRASLTELLRGEFGDQTIKDDPFQVIRSEFRGAEVIDGEQALTMAMVEAVEKAHKYIYTIGGRSRDQTYLDALKMRVGVGDVKYVRIVTGDHIRHPLCVHLRELRGKMEVGYLAEDKYGGVLATHDTVVIALQSSTVSSLDKGLRIRDPSLSVEYRSYIADLLATSARSLTDSFFKNLCTECRKELESNDKGKEA